MSKYFLYARKSTDEEDRQVLSIEAQVAELKEFAAKEKLEIVASFHEAKTAKEPGRTVFGEMLSRISAGEANGILAWHPDRLARNPIDGGQVIYMVDTGKINSLKFPCFWFEDTPQGKFMLNIAFGQSKYFIDNLSENVKRGLRQKLRRGEWPGWAPLGYLNDLKTHTVIVDKEKHKFIKRIFEMYATGNYGLKELSNIATNFGLINQNSKRMSGSMIQRMLQNPFYCGVFKYNGELHEAKHEPIISKKLFEQVQATFLHRGRPHKKKKHDYVFTSLMKCGACGCYITAEMQKGHVYYRCTKKKGVCTEKYVREEELAEQLKDVLEKVSLSDDWADKMLNQIEQDGNTTAQSNNALVQSIKNELETIDQKLDKLLDSHLDGLIEKQTYLKKKEVLINRKLVLEDKTKELLNKGINRLEPVREFILSSKQAKKIAQTGDLAEIRTFLKNVGSNFVLKDKKFDWLAKKAWRVVEKISPHTEWLGGTDYVRTALHHI